MKGKLKSNIMSVTLKDSDFNRTSKYEKNFK